MPSIVLAVPDEALVALGVSPENAGNELCFLAAVKLYELGRLSSGAAARLAGVARVVFLSRLGECGITTFDQTEEELGEELGLA